MIENPMTFSADALMVLSSLPPFLKRKTTDIERPKEDSVDRAWHFVEGWVAKNKACFDSAVPPCSGKIETGRVYIIASVLREALEKAGFSYTKCIRGFRDNDHIDVFESNEGTRNQCLKKIQGVVVRTFCAKISVNTEDFDDDEELLQ